MDGADAEKEINFMEQALHNSAEYLSGLLNVSQETIAAYGTVEQVDTGRVLILAVRLCVNRKISIAAVHFFSPSLPLSPFSSSSSYDSV